MDSFLKQYYVTLHTIGPVFVGSGKQFNKKEYIIDKKKKEVLVFDMGKMFSGLEKRHMGSKFEDYLLGGRVVLSKWFWDNNIRPAEYEKWVKYRIPCGDFFLKKGPLNVCECVMDAYGNPYIPGSSLKGMIRTILGAYWTYGSKQRDNWQREITRDIGKMQKQNEFLKQQIGDIENDIFHTVQRMDEKGRPVKKEDAVNDMMSGVIVSDSDPLTTRDLILCQKVDVDPDGKSHSINTLRESIRPGGEIHFTLTIDTRICPVTKQDLLDAVAYFSECYYNEHLSKFKSADRPSEDTVWLGGGSGFHTKTIVNSVFDGKEALVNTCKILSKMEDSKNKKAENENSKNKKAKNENDVGKGVSPHILKCTEYQGKRYIFGQCKLEIL